MVGATPGLKIPPTTQPRLPRMNFHPCIGVKPWRSCFSSRLMTAPPTVDRRQQHELRALFADACECLRPFFDPANQWTVGQSSEHLALRDLKERSPTLGAQDAFLVVMVAKRRFASEAHAPIVASPVPPPH